MTQEQQTVNLLETEYIGRNIKWFDEISSTNDYLKEEAPSLPDGFTAASTEQFAGKGRRGHTWVSSRGQMVAFSFFLKNNFFTDLPPITLMCGLAVAKALNGITGKKLLIKWPNDIIYEGRKVCGILCESKLLGRQCFNVCGIGVNLTQTEDFFKEVGIPHGVSLKMIYGTAPSPEEVVAKILNEFEKIYLSLTKGGDKEISEFLKEYSENCVTVGKVVKIVKPDCEIIGIALSVNRDGSLHVSCDGKETDVLASEASVRGVMGYS